MPTYTVKQSQHSDEKIIYLIDEKNQKETPLSSQRSSLKEAQRILDQHANEKPTAIVILGAGNPNLIKLSQKKFSLPIVVVAPDEKLIELGKTFLDEPFKGLHFLSDPILKPEENKKQKLLDEIESIFKKNPGAGKLILFLENQREVQLEKDFFAEVRKYFLIKQNEKSINRSTFRKFEKIWLKNVVKNSTYTVESLPINLLSGLANSGNGESGGNGGNSGSGGHALILGAGPSLQLDIPLIKKLQDYFFIIALDTVVKPLLLNGISPDAVISVDPQKINSRYLENLDDPSYGNGAHFYENTLLFAEPSICTNTLRRFKHRVVFDSFIPFYKFLCAFFGAKGEVNCGGSVVSAAYELARVMQFSSVTLCGVDFSFFLDHYHLTGTMYEQYWLENTRRFSTYEMNMTKLVSQEKLTIEKNPRAEVVYMDTPMKLYREWFETRDCKKHFANCINASKTGVEIKNFKRVPLEDVCDELSLKKNDEEKRNKKIILEKIETLRHNYKKKLLGPEENLYHTEAWKRFFETVKEVYKVLQTHRREINKNIDEIKIILKTKNPMNEEKSKKISKAIEKLKKTAGKMTEHVVVRDFISAAMQETINSVNDGDFGQLSKSSDDDSTKKKSHDMMRESVNYFVDFYTKLSSAAEFNCQIMDRFLFSQKGTI